MADKSVDICMLKYVRMCAGEPGTSSTTTTAEPGTTSTTGQPGTSTTAEPKSSASTIKSVFQFSHFILFTIVLTFLSV